MLNSNLPDNAPDNSFSRKNHALQSSNVQTGSKVPNLSTERTVQSSMSKQPVIGHPVTGNQPDNQLGLIPMESVLEKVANSIESFARDAKEHYSDRIKYL